MSAPIVRNSNGIQVATSRPAGYQSIGTVDGLHIKATMLIPFISDQDPQAFIDSARAANTVFFNWIDRLPASHPRMRIAAKRAFARALLAMYDDFKRRLTPKNLELYIRVAWPKNHPLAGAIDSCDPFMFAPIWRETLKPIKVRKRRRLTKVPQVRPGYKIPTSPKIRQPSISSKMDEARKKLGELQAPESDVANYATVSMDFIAAAIDLFAKGFGAKIGGTLLTIASLYLGMAATIASGVQTQYKQAQIWGFAWGLHCYGREIIAAGDKKYLSVNPKKIWSYVKLQPKFNEQKIKSMLMGKELDNAVERGVLDAVTFMNGVMIQIRKGIEKQLNQYAGILSQSEINALMSEHLYDARVEAYKYVSAKVAKQLKGKSMSI